MRRDTAQLTPESHSCPWYRALKSNMKPSSTPNCSF